MDPINKTNLGSGRGLKFIMDLVLLMSRVKVVVIFKVSSLLVLLVVRSTLDKILVGRENYFGCGKDGHKVRYFPNVASRGGEAKQDPPSSLNGGALKRNLFYALRASVSKTDDYDDVCKFICFSI